MAQASLAELQTQIEIAGRFGCLSTEEVTASLEPAISLTKQLYALRNALAKRG
jgi:four helix bundle protein